MGVYPSVRPSIHPQILAVWAYRITSALRTCELGGSPPTSGGGIKDSWADPAECGAQ